MKKWRNVDLSQEDAKDFRTFLRNHEITFETSGALPLVHFEVYVDEFEEQLCNMFLSGEIDERGVAL